MARDRRPVSHYVPAPREPSRLPRRCGRCDQILPAGPLRDLLEHGHATEREISDFVCGCVPAWAAEAGEG